MLMTSTIIALALAVYGFRHRFDSASWYFSLLMFAIAEWSFFQSFEAASSTRFYKILWGQVEYFGITGVPAFWYLLALAYSKKELNTLRRLSKLLLIIPTITIIMAFTNDLHGLLWSDIIPTDKIIPYISAGRHLTYYHGPWFWVNISYSYALLFTGSVLFIKEAIKSKHIYRSQPVIIIFAALFPWIANFLYITHLGPLPGVDFTCMAYTLSGFLIAWCIFKFKLLNILPIARHKIIDQMNDGVIVLDENNSLVDINPSARKLMGSDQDIKIGELFESVDNPLRGIIGGSSNPTFILSELYFDNTDKTMEVRVDPINDRKGYYRGCIVMLHDITEWKKKRGIIKYVEPGN